MKGCCCASNASTIAVKHHSYAYDKIGNLAYDKSEEIDSIIWNVYGKIERVVRMKKSDKSDLEFRYDAMGNRICKVVKPRAAGSGVMAQDAWTYTYYMRDASGNVIATYSRDYTAPVLGTYNDGFSLKENHLYGSSRAGIRTVDEMVSTVNYVYVSTNANGTFAGTFNSMASTVVSATNFNHELGRKAYELSNHLGNVLVTVSDARKGNNNPLAAPTVVAWFSAVVLSAEDYYAFGSEMVGRAYTSSGYRYAFNGKEKDNELTEGSLDFGARVYQSRLGKFLLKDYYANKFRNLSPYSFAGNSPIGCIDINGDSLYILAYTVGNDHGDGMLYAAALTRQNDIESGSVFDPARDKVVLVPVTDLGTFGTQVKAATTANSAVYGKTAEVSVYSHAGADGPVGTTTTSGNYKLSDEDPNQMSVAGWGAIDYNFVEGGGRMNFYGCKANSSNFCQRLSEQTALSDVTVAATAQSQYPSQYTDVRSCTIAMDNNIYATTKAVAKRLPVYMVGATDHLSSIAPIF